MIKPVVVDTGVKNVICAVLEPKGTIVDGFELTDEQLMFDIQTFNKLKRLDLSEWNITAPVNDFLRTLPIEEYRKIVEVFFRTKNILHKVDEEEVSIINAIAGIDKLFSEMVEKTGMIPKVLVYVESAGINIPDLSDIGGRPQDSKAMTFVREDYITLSAIIIICKLCFPIYGEIIRSIMAKKDMNRELKEKYCVGILKTTLKIHFPHISKKLFEYIGAVTKSYQATNILFSFQGYTKETLISTMFASMLVKKFVNIDLHKKDGNIMSFAITCIKSTVVSMFGKFRKLGSFFARFEPQDNAGDEESKRSLLENESIAFTNTSDIPIIVTVGIEKFINDYIRKNNIRVDITSDSYDFYKNFAIQITPINEYLISLFIGKEIGGAIGIRYITGDLYIKTLILIQIYMARNGFSSLVPLLTMLPTNQPKTEIDSVSNHILLTKGIGTDYRNCKEKLVHLDDNFSWERHFKVMVEYLVKRHHQYNVSPAIQELLPSSNNTNGSIYKYDSQVVEEIYRFTFEMLERSDKDFDDVRVQKRRS